MAEEPIPSFLGQPDEVINKKYDNLLSDLTSQTVGGYSFSNISDAIKEAEVGGDKNATGWPYIFTKSGKTSSAFGPIQITYSTVLDYFVGAGKEKDQLARFRAGDFVAGYSQLPADVKSYLKSFVEQGIKKRNNKKPQDGGAYGNLGIGDISKADHEKYYPFLVGVHIREKKKIAKDDTVPSFINAHYGSVEHSNEDIKKARTKARNNLQTKVNEALDIEATPTTEADAQLFTELERYVPAMAKPDSAPDMDDSDVVEPGTTDTLETVMQEEFQRSVDAADRDEQKQQEATLQTIQSKDVAPDTTDAIPTAEPEEKGLFSRAISGVGEFLFGDDDDTPAEPKVDKNEIIRRSLLKELDTSGVPNMNKGGMPMERQMNMFDEGGLFDEGGTIDEQSGNDVPPGSLKEEVRDDIPAQLSEGEFVFPADVVRYWGLEKLMEMRQEAKAGLARMEAMGQMGNSEEATIPDDLPFTLDDLDMDDDPMEFQVGGLVPNQFGITEQPSQFATYNQQPYVAPTIPTGQPIQQQPLQTGFTPLTTPAVPTDGTVAPTFEQLLPTTTGRYDELREYINNDTGQTMTIPFIDGNPIYPIPPGFVEVQKDEVEAVETPTTVVPTAQVQSPDDDGDSTNDVKYATTDVTGIGYSKNLLEPELREVISDFGFGFGALASTFNIAGNIANDLSKDPRATASTMSSSSLGGVFDSFRGGNVNFTDRPGSKTGQYDDNMSLHEMSDFRQREIARVARSVVTSMRDIFVDENGKGKSEAAVIDALVREAKRRGIKTTRGNTNILQRPETLAREISKQRADEARKATDEQLVYDDGSSVIEQITKSKSGEEDYSDSTKQNLEALRADQAARAREAASRRADEAASGGTQYSVSSDPYSSPGEIASREDRFGEAGLYMKRGGLASKPKPKPKAKKMKRGGLASKK